MPLSTKVLNLQGPESRRPPRAGEGSQNTDALLVGGRFSPRHPVPKAPPALYTHPPPDSLHKFVLPEVGKHVTVVAENVAGEKLDAVLVADLVDLHHHIPGAAGQADLEAEWGGGLSAGIRHLTPPLPLLTGLLGG